MNASVPRAEVLGKTSLSIGLWVSLAERESVFAQLREEGRVRGAQVRLRNRAGELRQAELWIEALLVGGDPCLLATALSLPLLTNLPSLLKAIDAVRADHPRLPIVVGGQAFRFGGQEALQAYPDVTFLASFTELEKRLASFEP